MLLGDDGAAEGLPEGGLAIDMSTIAPTASRSIGKRLGERGFSFLDAPVTGSRPKAEDGTLTIMAGGPEAAFVRARPAFEAMGELVLHVGPQGHGSMIKLINNTLAAINAAGLAEGIVLAETAGLDVDKMLEVVGSGSGDSAMRALKSESMVEGDFETLFKLEHMLKDVRYCIAEARKLGLEACDGPGRGEATTRRRDDVAGHGERGLRGGDRGGEPAPRHDAPDRRRGPGPPELRRGQPAAAGRRHLDRGVPPRSRTTR